MRITEPKPNEIPNAFKLLGKNLAKRKLPTPNGERNASAEEFILSVVYRTPKGQPQKYAFKHDYTRNYVYLSPSGFMTLGDGVSAFQKHDFSPPDGVPML